MLICWKNSTCWHTGEEHIWNNICQLLVNKTWTNRIDDCYIMCRVKVWGGSGAYILDCINKIHGFKEISKVQNVIILQAKKVIQWFSYCDIVIVHVCYNWMDTSVCQSTNLNTSIYQSDRTTQFCYLPGTLVPLWVYLTS